ncbi:MAG: malonic semialdehyde reductase [Ilumatobacteraceae bacterium]|jgi:3-hydroxypropanoate dehydrogenase
MTAPYVIDSAAQDVLFRAARTANTFTDEPVTDEQIAALYDLVQWGPTTMNCQPMRLVVARSAEARATVIEHLLPGNRAKSEQAPLIAVVAADTNYHDHFERTFPHFPGARDLHADEQFRLATARSQTWLQAGYLIVGIRSIGLAAGPMLGYDAAGLDAAMFAGSGLVSVMVLNIGRPGPDAWWERLPRLPLDEVVLER